ncbi:MAG: ribbon-helix-helix protein, CopG family [Nanoarchaeota archaeon]|nr:ribbon-helix-helix protein, CopG family [Nanoarchaeota archaeon]
MKRVLIQIPEKLYEDLQEIVNMGYYASLNELVRQALREEVEVVKEQMKRLSSTLVEVKKGKLLTEKQVLG